MPSSNPEAFPVIVHILEEVNPHSVLDIGPGKGKYGLAVIEYLHRWPDCLEVFEGYITLRMRETYKNIYIGNALTYAIPKYDMYLLIDVLEHLPKDEGHKLLERLTKQGKVLISTPRSVMPQGVVFGNKWEEHISQWNGEDFERYPYKHYHNEFSFIYLLG